MILFPYPEEPGCTSDLESASLVVHNLYPFPCFKDAYQEVLSLGFLSYTMDSHTETSHFVHYRKVVLFSGVKIMTFQGALCNFLERLSSSRMSKLRLWGTLCPF